jgi:hypothetical protein
MISGCSVLAFKRHNLLNNLLCRLEQFRITKVTILQDYDNSESDDWIHTKSVIRKYCANNSSWTFIANHINLGPHDSFTRLLQANIASGERFFTFFEEDIIPSLEALSLIKIYQDKSDSLERDFDVCSISVHNGTLPLRLRNTQIQQILRNQFFSVWGSCTRTDYIRKYYRYTIPPSDMLFGLLRGKISRSVLRTFIIQSLKTWTIYDYNFTLMLIESNAFQLCTTASLVEHLGIGLNSTHYSHLKDIDYRREISVLDCTYFDLTRLEDSLSHTLPIIDCLNKEYSHWGYHKLRYYRHIYMIACVLITSMCRRFEKSSQNST